MKTELQASDFRDLTFAIIGLGLIGGSYAKALRLLHVKKILGMDISHGIAKACLNARMIDEIVPAGDTALAEADVIICSVYPDAVLDFVQKNVANFKKGVLMTDASGIKGTMPEDVQKLLPAECRFISGHPMAGKQGSGLGMSDAAIFNGANYIIVPTEKNTEADCQWLEQFAKALGCTQTVRITAIEHDKIIAYTSNLPHALAVSLVNSASFSEHTKYFVAGSFRDATRVADINPELWSALFLDNKDNVIAEIDKFQQQLQQWKTALENKDAKALQAMMSAAGSKRREMY